VKAEAPQLIFVYGTLKRGGSNHRYLSGQSFRGQAHTTPGLSLIHLGDFPGLVFNPDDQEGVSGEVWLVDAACVARLDELEGVNEGLYRRERIDLQPPFSSSDVQTYVYSQAHDGHPIKGGMWTEPHRAK
jgi:gamma-glutamylaminecyclotransferase